MSNVYDLDALRADLDNAMAPYQLTLGGETLRLLNLMRCGSGARKNVMLALKVIEASQDETKEQTPEDVAALSDAVEVILRNVTADDKGDKLIAAIGGDLMLAMKVLEGWTKATQAGEAQPSSS